MPRENAIRLEGRIIEARPNGTFRVELSNGHRLLAYVARRTDRVTGVRPGHKVTLELSPCDFSTGRIIEMEKQT